MKDETMTLQAAADRLGVSTFTVRRAVRAGKIRARYSPNHPERICGIYRGSVEKFENRNGRR